MDASQVPICCRPWWTPLLIAFGMPPSKAYLDIDPERVRVRMGVGFRADVPRASVRAPRRRRNQISVGVHGRRGSWLINGAMGPLVALTLDPPSRARVYGFPVRLRALTVSVDDPDGLIAKLSA